MNVDLDVPKNDAMDAKIVAAVNDLLGYCTGLPRYPLQLARADLKKHSGLVSEMIGSLIASNRLIRWAMHR